MKKEQHINSVTSQERFDHFNKVLDCESLSISDNAVQNNALASIFGPGQSLDTLWTASLLSQRYRLQLKS